MKSDLEQNNTPAVTPSGGALVATFVTAMTNLTTALTAKYTAKQSEANALRTIETVAVQQQMSGQTALTSPEALIKSSVNAHLQKVQADKIDAFTNAQLMQLEAELKQTYRGKKVVVTVLDPTSQPVESYWFNKQTGQYKSGQLSAVKIKGVVDDLSLFKNVLILTPTLGSRLLMPNRKYYAVYPVNPQTLQPMVSLVI